MRTIIAFIVLNLGLASALSSEPFPVDVKQEATAEHEPAIDHLVPINRTVPEFYYLAQFSDRQTTMSSSQSSLPSICYGIAYFVIAHCAMRPRSV
jgi:hypothetical protein